MRELIHLLFLAHRNPWGMAVMLIIWVASLYFVLDITKVIRHAEPFNTAFCGIVGVFLFFKLGQIGAKIDAEKRRFTRWLEILTSDTAQINRKEQVAEWILESPDLDKNALNQITFFTNNDTPVYRAAIEKIKKMETII